MFHQPKATKSLTRTSNLTPTLGHRGAGLPRKSALVRESQYRLSFHRKLETGRFSVSCSVSQRQIHLEKSKGKG